MVTGYHQGKTLLFITCLVIGMFARVANAGDIFDLGELHFETVSTPEQIPDGLVTALAQDTRGFIWV
ncbi:MAG: hypothetical protein HRT35_32200, partial [Algicola sp.]|nr:hypothetical protein [Algicola sp.]